MSQATLRVQKISGHAGSVPGEDTQRQYTVAKLVDTTTCIGCKACEVACVEWNDMPFSPTTPFDNTYQTMPETRWNYWNLILFNEAREGRWLVDVVMRKNQCMHCAEPGCLAACPADGAIIQYTTASWIFSRTSASGAATASADGRSIFRSSIKRRSGLQVHAVHGRVSEGWSRLA